MKKLLVLALALIFVLGLSAPAFAFTSDTDAKSEVPYKLSLYLVDYEDNDLFGVANLPKSDRGYAKNEIVAAVVELYVPEGETIKPPNNLWFILSGENADFDVTDNFPNGTSYPELQTSFNMADPGIAVPAPMWNIFSPTDHDKIDIVIINLPGEGTYRWLFFAKVTGDGASLTAKLMDGTNPDFEISDTFPGIPITLDGIQYVVARGPYPTPTSDDIVYQIGVGSGDYVGYSALIFADEHHKSEGMMLVTSEGVAILGVNTDGELGVAEELHPAVLMTSGDLYDDAMDFYNDVVVDVFGLDYMLIGNYVRDSYFNALISPRTLVATVNIEPWTAYVTVPDDIVVDPPKTGDAASIMGFVTIALSCAGAAILKKRG